MSNFNQKPEQKPGQKPEQKPEILAPSSIEKISEADNAKKTENTDKKDQPSKK